MDVTTQNDRDENRNALMNTTLLKSMGLYQVLNPRTVRYCGWNVYHVTVALVMMLYEIPLSIIFFAQSAYYCTSDTNSALLSFAAAEIIVFACYKTVWVVYKSDEIWQCLKVSRLAFTSYGRYDRITFETRRAFSVRITYAIFAFGASCCVTCLVGPLMFEGIFMSVTDHDGSIGKYRLNAMNLYFFTSAETYNAHFNTFYAIEFVYLAVCNFLVIAMDVLVITLSLAVACRFQIVSDAFKSIGPYYFDAHSSAYREFLF